MVLAISVLPAGTVKAPEVLGFDKLAHAVVYGVLAFLIHRAASWPCLACGVIVTASCGALGAVLEFVQSFVPGRHPSVADAIANLLGAGLASIVYVKWRTRG